MTQWYRSWPERVPEHLLERPRIVDTLPRLLMSGWDYYTVKTWPEESFLMLEWDVALDGLGRRYMEQAAIQTPNTVCTAPYRLNDGRFLTEGFGCIYFPRHIIDQFVATEPPIFSDVTWFNWMRDRGIQYRVIENVFPQHLNSWDIEPV